jgi:hypothetical protein
VALLCGAEASKSGRARPEASGGTFRGFFYLFGGEMLVPPDRKPSTPTPGPLRRTLLGAFVVIGAMCIGLVILWVITEWLWLVVHQGL